MRDVRRSPTALNNTALLTRRVGQQRSLNESVEVNVTAKRDTEFPAGRRTLCSAAIRADLLFVSRQVGAR
jgi:hypothetical protein